MRDRENIYEAMKYAHFWDDDGNIRHWADEPKRMQKNDDGVLQALWWGTVTDTEYEADGQEHIAYFELIEFRPESFYVSMWTDMVVWEEGSDPLILEGEDEPYYNRYGMEYCVEEVEFSRSAALMFLRDLLGGRLRKGRGWGFPNWEIVSGAPAERQRVRALRDPKKLAAWISQLGMEYVRSAGSGCDYQGELPEEAWDLL